MMLNKSLVIAALLATQGVVFSLPVPAGILPHRMGVDATGRGVINKYVFFSGFVNYDRLMG